MSTGRGTDRVGSARAAHHHAYLRAAQIQQFAEDVLGHAIDMTAVQEILDVFDHNNDGEISLEEVRQYVMRHNKPLTPSA
jgi:Ca2+-binding EF-hand superfamily protein